MGDETAIPIVANTIDVALNTIGDGVEAIENVHEHLIEDCVLFGTQCTPVRATDELFLETDPSIVICGRRVSS